MNTVVVEFFNVNKINESPAVGATLPCWISSKCWSQKAPALATKNPFEQKNLAPAPEKNRLDHQWLNGHSLTHPLNDRLEWVIESACAD